MFESKGEDLLSRRDFYARLLRSFSFALAALLVSLAVGMSGYHYIESMPWIDAFANASMILSGMGPLAQMNTFGGKLFAGCYALYSGIALIGAMGVILAPMFHRFLHRFHAECDDEDCR